MDKRKEGRIREEYKTQQSCCVVASFPCSFFFLTLSPLHPKVDKQDCVIQYDTIVRFANLSKKYIFVI